MDIHHLRVVNFDNITNVNHDDICIDVRERNIPEERAIEQRCIENSPQADLSCGDGKSISNHPSHIEKDGKVSFQTCTVEVKEPYKARNPYISKYDKQLLKKREAKKEREKDKYFKGRKQKKYKYRNTLSFENLMKTLSTKNDEYFTRIQNNLQRYSSFIIPMHEKRRKKKQKNQLPNEVKVLYVSETAKIHKRTRKHSSNKHTSVRTLPTRVKSFSSHDIFGFHRNRHGYNRNLHRYNERPYDVNFCGNIFQKNRKRITDRYQMCQPRKSFTIRRVKSNTSGCCERPMHFTLVDFPSASNTCCTARSYIKMHVNAGDQIHRSCKDVGVSVVPSRFQISKKTRDTAVLTSRPVQGKGLGSCQTSAHQCKRAARSIPTLSYTPAEIFNKMFHPTKSRPCIKRECSAETILKYFLLGLMIAVWFPCVTLIGLIWLLTYPMRPHYDILAAKGFNARCSGDSKKKSIWTPFINFTKKIVKDTFCFVHAIGGMYKSDSKGCKKTTAPCRSLDARPSSPNKSQPDPNKKYTPFYANKRGFLMKPNCRHFARKHKSMKNKIFNGFNRFYQNRMNLSRGQIIIGSVNEVKKHDRPLNNLKLNCPCSIRCSHEQPPIVILSDTIRNAQAVESQKKIPDRSPSPKPVSLKKISPPRKYDAPMNSLQPQSKQAVSQRPSQVTKVKIVDTSPSPIKSQFQRRSLEKQSPPSPHHSQSPSSKRLISRGTSSPQRRKTTKDYKTSGSKSPTKEISPTLAKDRRTTQTGEDKTKKAKLQSAAKRIRIEATRRYKQSQCNLIKSPAPRRKNKEKVKKHTCAQKAQCKMRTACRFLKSLQEDVDATDHCDLYLQTLRNKPCFCVYNCCPSIYPFFLMWRKCTMDCFHIMMYVCSICVWTPVFLTCYSCYWLCCFVIFR